MKKTLVAIAALAAVSAFAQSTVTLSGNVGGGYQSKSDKTKGFTFTDADLNVGVVEDLGGGMSVRATTRFQTTADSFRAGVLRGDTTLALVTGFGAFSLANVRSSDLMTQAFSTVPVVPDGVYDSTGILARGAIDAFTYTARFNSITASVSLVESGAPAFTATNIYAVNDNTWTLNNARRTMVYTGLYSNGPIAGGLSLKSASNNDKLFPATTFNGTVNPANKKTNFEGFVTYDLGVAKIGLGFDSKIQNLTAANAALLAAGNPAAAQYSSARLNKAFASNAYSMGVTVPMGAVSFGMNYAKRGENKLYELGAAYSMSKRTTLAFGMGKHSGIGANGYSNAPVAAVGGVGGTVAAVCAAGSQLPVLNSQNISTPQCSEASQFRIRLMHTF